MSRQRCRRPRQAGPARRGRLGKRELIDSQIDVIAREWNEVCDRAEMTSVDRFFFWRRQFLNPYAFEGYTPTPI